MKFTNEENEITWKKVLENDLQFQGAYKVLPTKGNMAWEYNPFRNYRLDQDMFEYNGKLYEEDELKNILNGDIYKDENKKEYKEGIQIYQKGELVDFITNELSFDINHPVSILPSYSYDGSVDLILNDGKNQPRLINSRFSTTGMNTYEVVNRTGDNDTNIYDRGIQFDVDTSLYKKTTKIPKLTFNGTQSGGDLKIGNYHFYFKYADADGNETDFVAESGLVSIFKGITSPYSISTGQKNENSLKCVSFTLKNIDLGYQYLYVYYTRSTAEGNENFETFAVKINKKFLISSTGACNILITGNEETIDIPISDINLEYNVIKAAKSQAICQNMLFLANVQKAEIPYTELQDLSLRFLPYLNYKQYNVNEDQNYSIVSSNKGYCDSKFIYNFTGYWNSDLYRLGIVYILKDNTLSPVFNIRGRIGVKQYTDYSHNDDGVNSSAYTKIAVYNQDKSRKKVNYDESTYYVLPEGESTIGVYENVKGVVSFDADLDTDQILGFDIRADKDTLTELKKYTKGFFFVRQRRMPMTLCQGITIGIEKNSHLPAIPTIQGVTDIKYDFTNVETEDMNPNATHYILEGFLGRYTYKYVKKSSGFWSKVLKAVSIAAVVAVGVCGAVFSGGTSLMAAGAAIASVVGISSTMTATLALGLVAASAAAVVGTTAVITASVAGVQSIVLSSQQSRNKSKTKYPYRGLKESIPRGYKREEIDESRKIDAAFNQRIILTDPKDCEVQAMYVPEYTVNQGKYNQIFNGDEFTVQYTNSQATTNFTDDGYFVNNNDRHFYISGYSDSDNSKRKEYVYLQGVPDGIAIVSLRNNFFRSQAGDSSSINRFQYIRQNYTDDTLNHYSDIVRGMYSPYVAMVGFQGPAATTLNIKVPGYDPTKMSEYVDIRMSDHSEYSAISDRFDISELGAKKSNLANDTTVNTYYFQTTCYRGDCYICQYTQRINRNFNDATSPYNDVIVNPKTWRNYDINNEETLSKVNIGDLNAVQLGMWITFKVRSSYNLNIRTEDPSQVAERASCGHDRSYFPRTAMSTAGAYKTPDSLVYNQGFSKSLSDRYHFNLPDAPYYNTWYGTRIMYSDIDIASGFQNGFRTFRSTTYQDYTREYGSITKIIELSGNLLVVFEHGIGLLGVNEKAVAASVTSGNVYMTSEQVIQDKVEVISDAIGSQWIDSIIKVPATLGSTKSVVFGVDTVAKKIWMCDGGSVQCISDFKVQEFLNNNITLGERDNNVVMGVRNVKTVYNAFKQDIMFTFYDCLDGIEEKAWNLCYNLTIGKFTTFYSWIPAFMENIDNIPFSFDRDVVKAIGKLGISKSGNDFSDGIILSNNIVSPDNIRVGELGLANRVIPFSDTTKGITTKIVYELVRDEQENYKIFEIINNENHAYLQLKQSKFEDVKDSSGNNITQENKIQYKAFSAEDKANLDSLNAELYYRNIQNHEYSDWPANSNQPNYCTDETYLWRSQKTGESDDDYKAWQVETLNKIRAKNLPIYKDRSGRKIMLPEADRLNDGKIVRYLNIRATIYVNFNNDNASLFDVYKSKYGNNEDIQDGYYNCGYYESTVAITTEWNLQFLTSDFWKHGQAGLIDICDDIKPTVWYGKQHPFEFECVVVNDPGVQKIFQNLEILSNKAEPESFHYEIVGESYSFAKDKKNMFFRQEAKKALLQYNGIDITYDNNFLKITPEQQMQSAELIYKYYSRQDKLQEIKDTYVGSAINSAIYSAKNKYRYNSNYNLYEKLIDCPNDYRYYSGAEIVYYKNRNEYRIWQHQPAINMDNLSQDSLDSVIVGNCQYLEDRWRVVIKPLLVCFKNEYSDSDFYNSTWALSYDGSTKLPPITLKNSKWDWGEINNYPNVEYPDSTSTLGKNNALYQLYKIKDSNDAEDVPTWYDLADWSSISHYTPYAIFGENQNIQEVPLRDKFMKVRVRYSGEDLAIIDALLTTYTLSYA